MTDYGTIKIPEDEYEKHNRKRKRAGLSWAEYIDGEAPEIDHGVDYDEIERRIERVFEQFAR